MTDVFKESGGKYTGELKKAFAWVADEGSAKPLAEGVELMVRNSFLLKRVTGVSKLMPTETSPLSEPTGTPSERFPAGFTPEPPIANAETGLYDGWLVVETTLPLCLATRAACMTEWPRCTRLTITT